MRPTITFGYNRPVFRTLTDVPIDRSQCSSLRTNLMKLCNLNARSIKSKSADFLCYVKSCAADIFAITETWFNEKDSAHRAEVTPPGYMLYDHARSGRSGGGTALLCRDSISVTRIAAGEKKSFEFSEWIILGRGSRKVRVVVLYRLQYSSSHPVSVDVFFEEFSAYPESLILSSEPLLITGDFNIHVDVVGDPVRAKFFDLLEAMDMLQHVTTPTHESGHTLDLIITRQCDALVKDPPVSDYHISDHWSVTCLLNLEKPTITRKTKTIRKTKNIDTAALSNELAASDLCTNTPEDLNDLVHCYITTLASALDRHAPLVTRSSLVRPLVPLFNNDIKEVRKERRKAERRWRRTGLLSDLRRYKVLRNKTNNLMTEARRVFYRELIDENCGDQKRLFSVTKRLLGSGREIQYPPFKDKAALANKFGEFFAQKIVTI